MHAFFCAVSFVLVYFLYPETRGVPLEEMDKLFGDEIVDDDDDDNSDADEASLLSETSSLVGSRRRSRSTGSSLPTSRKSSPAPRTRNSRDEGLISRMTGGLLRRGNNGPDRTSYRALSGQ
uniref:Sugar transporter n=1 Tax=Tremella fuciformis TaxID=64657 RepID=D5KY60_9TREE|nr:sugar transporter [Tremella fuciformis]